MSHEVKPNIAHSKCSLKTLKLDMSAMSFPFLLFRFFASPGWIHHPTPPTFSKWVQIWLRAELSGSDLCEMFTSLERRDAAGVPRRRVSQAFPSRDRESPTNMKNIWV